MAQVVARTIAVLALLVACWSAAAQPYSPDVLVHWSGGSPFPGVPGGPEFSVTVHTDTRWPGRLEFILEGQVMVRSLSWEEMRRLSQAIEEAQLDRCAEEVRTWEPRDNWTSLELPQSGTGPVTARLAGAVGDPYDIPAVYPHLSPRERDETLRYNRVIRVLKALLGTTRHARMRRETAALTGDLRASPTHRLVGGDFGRDPLPKAPKAGDLVIVTSDSVVALASTGTPSTLGPHRLRAQVTADPIRSRGWPGDGPGTVGAVRIRIAPSVAITDLEGGQAR